MPIRAGFKTTANLIQTLTLYSLIIRWFKQPISEVEAMDWQEIVEWADLAQQQISDSERE